MKLLHSGDNFMMRNEESNACIAASGLCEPIGEASSFGMTDCTAPLAGGDCKG